jgi:hypothetical protein
MRLLGKRRDRSEGEGRPPAPFVVGMNRSGTTLLRMMLDAHSQLTVPPETHFVPELIEACEDREVTPERLVELVASQREWGDFEMDADEVLAIFRSVEPLTAGGALRAFYDAYAKREGKPRWGDKTPAYIHNMVEIQGSLPEARFVHLIRDGRDVALSVSDRAMKPAPMSTIAQRWKRRITKAREQAPRLDHYMEARYEDLILDTEGTLKRICEFSELPWDPGMLDYHERAEERLQEMARDLPAKGGRLHQPAERRLETHAMTKEPPRSERVHRWKTKMSEADREEFESVAGELLAELGYEVPSPLPSGGDGAG